MKIILSQLGSDDIKEEIKLIVHRIATQNGVDIHSIRIVYDDK
jgi:hypothetical protein